MQSMQSKVSSMFEYVKDSTNPFVRLVVNATLDNGTPNVSFYQVDEVREASFQSDYACEMIVKGITMSLESQSQVVLHKTLTLLRMLMLEGATGVSMRAGKFSGRLAEISASAQADRFSITENNRSLASALHLAILGDSSKLSAYTPDTRVNAQNASRGNESSETKQSYKSEFQVVQEREQRHYRKRLEEKKNAPAVLVRDRVVESFDSSLSPAKLVDQAVTSPKKKYCKEDLDSFADAVEDTGHVREVCIAIDAHLNDKRQTLQNRFKALLLADALVSEDISDAVEYFRAHQAGLQRHCTTHPAENQVKAEAAKSLAQHALNILKQARTREASAASTPAPQSAPLPPAQQQLPQQSRAAPAPPQSSTVQQPSQQQQQQQQPSTTGWMWNGPNAAPTTTSIDDLFADMHVKPSTARTTQQQAPQQQQQQQQQQWGNAFSWGNDGSTVSTTAGSGSSSSTAPQAAPGLFGITALSAVPRQDTRTPSTTPPIQPAAAGSMVDRDVLLKQAAELQRNMQMMAAMFQSPQQPQQQQQQQPQQQPAPQRELAWPPAAGPSHQPSPQPSQTSVVSTPQPQPASLSPAFPAETTSSIAPSASVQSVPPQSSGNNANGADSTAATLSMMQQLQAQMEATQKMLAQQQAAFNALQAQLQGKRE